MVGQANDKHQVQINGLKLYVKTFIESEVWPTVVHFKRCS